MILRPLSSPATGAKVEPVWTAVERSQQEDFSGGCWMIPQPSHAALAGDLAANLDPASFPGITPEIVRAIALHDAGWSPDDAFLIQESRAKGVKARLHAFIAAQPRDATAAWTGSVEIAGKGSPIGAFLVSRHFCAIAGSYSERAEGAAQKILRSFLTAEAERQQKARRKLALSDGDLDRLLQALQFCDLLSLYLCCGLQSAVEFPQAIAGRPMRLRQDGGFARLEPSPFPHPSEFSVSGIRHPRTPVESGASFTVAVR